MTKTEIRKENVKIDYSYYEVESPPDIKEGDANVTVKGKTSYNEKEADND